MHRTEIFAVDLSRGMPDPAMERRWYKYNDFPVGTGCRLAADGQECTLKFRAKDGRVVVCESKFHADDGESFVRIPREHVEEFNARIAGNDLGITIVEGVTGAVVVIPYFIEHGCDFFDEVRSKYPSIRLESYDLPPRTVTSVNATQVASWIYRELGDRDPELFRSAFSGF
jgi:hypothetical protein